MLWMQLFCGFAIALAIHEAGHALVAAWFGVRVERFFLFLEVKGHALVRFRIRNTEFGIGWLPIGSFVQLAGLRTDQRTPPKPFHFSVKSFSERMLIVMGGPLANMATAFVLFRAHPGVMTPLVAGMAVASVYLTVRNLLPWANTDGPCLARMVGDHFYLGRGERRVVQAVLLVIAVTWWLPLYAPLVSCLSALFA